MIRQYLAAFYDGTASEQEERALDAFFAQTDMPERWVEDRRFFLMLRDSSAIPLPGGLAARLEKRLDGHIARDKRRFLRRSNFYKLTGVAAALLFCLSISFYQEHSPACEANTMVDTFEDPHEAAKVAGQALTLLSLNLNKGMEQVREAERELQQVNEILNDQLK